MAKKSTSKRTKKVSTVSDQPSAPNNDAPVTPRGMTTGILHVDGSPFEAPNDAPENDAVDEDVAAVVKAAERVATLVKKSINAETRQQACFAFLQLCDKIILPPGKLGNKMAGAQEVLKNAQVTMIDITKCIGAPRITQTQRDYAKTMAQIFTECTNANSRAQFVKVTDANAVAKAIGESRFAYLRKWMGV